ncbi:TonB-dependent receptor [Niabella yanshanensis]|uniref:TonB-dependent receptor n=1 Tax=Niabella yanshanensis TaxID=577386 RepID=A0ABZ0W735_9BACT|nr:TonB-dependent receptor [Niabella yanshanensis]WQD38307.1 TonB-dependent receptor [Niabella yanshanensis]
MIEIIRLQLAKTIGRVFSGKSLPILVCFLALMPAISGASSLWQTSIKGKVSDSENGQPLTGVSVSIKGQTAGATTNEKGEYVVEAKTGDVLVFSFVGYISKEFVVTDNTVVDITLEKDVASLDEVVAVGYGVQKKRDITGAISSVSAKDIENTPVKDVLTAMQGRMAGVQVVSNSGAPGDGISVTVRGQSSLNAGNAPLYVVDGIPIESSSISQLNGFDSHGLSPLSYINPADIQSIEVLKDAASTAIYGSRAANGVVMITTKSGKAGKAKVSLNFYTGVSKITRYLDVLNATQWRANILDAYKNLDKYNGATIPTIPHWSVLDSLNPMNNGDVDWQDVMYRTANQKQANVSVNGGSEKARYSLSTSLLDQDGIFIASNYKRITSRLNTDFDISSKIKLGYNILYSHELNNRINAGGDGNHSLVQSILVRPPTYALTYPDGSPINYFNGKRNPVGLALEATHTNRTHRLVGSQYLEYQILKNLKFRTNVSIDFLSMKEDEFLPATVDYREGYNSGAVRSITNFTWANENYFTYNTTLNERHNISAMAGFSQQAWKLETTGLDGMYFASDNIRTLNGAGTISNQAVNTTVEHGMASYYGRVGYNYDSKYIVQANIRADGSSRFGKKNRFGYFPSVSAAWRFSAEPFLEKLSFLSDGKLRFSVGQTGNEAIGNYTARGEFAIGANYLDNSGAAPTIMPNSGLTWETSTQYDLGLDLSLFNYRVSLSGDVYVKNTNDLLFDVPIPETSGFGYITQNIGSIQNKGFELSLTTFNLTRDFKWNTNFNIGVNRNKIISLPDNVLTNGYIQNGVYHILKVGQPIGVFYGYKFLGVYVNDADNVNQVRNASSNGKIYKGGDPIWDDLNGDNIIDARDQQIIGNGQPDYTGGITNDFSYKNFSLNVFFQFSKGNQIYSILNQLRNSVVAYNNVSRDALTRWKEQGDITDYPRPIFNDPLNTNSRVSDRWIYDGSYLRLKTVRLSYSLPQHIINRLKISAVKLYASGENLITWTRYTGYDPDISSYSGLRIGLDGGSYPQSRTFIFGLNVDL